MINRSILLLLASLFFIALSNPAFSQHKPSHKHSSNKTIRKKTIAKKDQLSLNQDSIKKLDSIVEPSLEATKAWVLQKITDFKPTVFFVKEKELNTTCEWEIKKVSFDKSDKLIINLSSGNSDKCLKNVTAILSIDFSSIDISKTLIQGQSRKVNLFTKGNTQSFIATFSPALASKSFINKINFIYFSFDNLTSLYETNLSTRLAKAFNRLVELKQTQNLKQKETF